MVGELRIERSAGAMNNQSPKGEVAGQSHNFDSELKDAQQELYKKKEKKDSLGLPFPFHALLMPWDAHFSGEVTSSPVRQADSRQSEQETVKQTTASGVKETHKPDEKKEPLDAFLQARVQLDKDTIPDRGMMGVIIPQFTLYLPENMKLDVNQLASRIADQIKALKAKFETIKIAVSPKELGNINLTIKMVDGKVNISIAVDFEQEKFFENNIKNLIAELQKQNIAVGELSVSINNRFQGNNNSNYNFKKKFETASFEKEQAIPVDNQWMYRLGIVSQVI